MLQSRFKQFWITLYPRFCSFIPLPLFSTRTLTVLDLFTYISIYRMVKITIRGELVDLNTRFPMGVKGYENSERPLISCSEPCIQIDLVYIPAQLCTSLGKLYNLTDRQFSYVQNRGINIIFLIFKNIFLVLDWFRLDKVV